MTNIANKPLAQKVYRLMNEIEMLPASEQQTKVVTMAGAILEEIAEFRPEVLEFAILMELQLRANDHKAGWKKDTALMLWHRLGEESDELYRAFTNDVPPVAIGMEAADVANFAMMIADVCGALVKS